MGRNFDFFQVLKKDLCQKDNESLVPGFSYQKLSVKIKKMKKAKDPIN